MRGEGLGVRVRVGVGAGVGVGVRVRVRVRVASQRLGGDGGLRRARATAFLGRGQGTRARGAQAGRAVWAVPALFASDDQERRQMAVRGGLGLSKGKDEGWVPHPHKVAARMLPL